MCLWKCGNSHPPLLLSHVPISVERAIHTEILLSPRGRQAENGAPQSVNRRHLISVVNRYKHFTNRAGVLIK